MSVIYYCDAPGCVKKAPGQETPEGWTGPAGWKYNLDDNGMLDACCDEHLDAAIAANAPPEPEADPEEEAEESAETE